MLPWNCLGCVDGGLCGLTVSGVRHWQLRSISHCMVAWSPVCLVSVKKPAFFHIIWSSRSTSPHFLSAQMCPELTQSLCIYSQHLEQDAEEMQPSLFVSSVLSTLSWLELASCVGSVLSGISWFEAGTCPLGVLRSLYGSCHLELHSVDLKLEHVHVEIWDHYMAAVI